MANNPGKRRKSDTDLNEVDSGLDLELSLRALRSAPSVATRKPNLETSFPPPPSLESLCASSIPSPSCLSSPLNYQNHLPPDHLPRRRKQRRNPHHIDRNGELVRLENQPYPWCGNLKATVKSKSELANLKINTIEGELKCKKCNIQIKKSVQLNKEADLVMQDIKNVIDSGHNRAPPEFSKLNFSSCPSCHKENCLKPVVACKDEEINWLFLFLQKSLGILNMDQLKFFCLFNNVHITGSKHHLLLYTYMMICKQLDPEASSYDIPV